MCSSDLESYYYTKLGYKDNQISVIGVEREADTDTPLSIHQLSWSIESEDKQISKLDKNDPVETEHKFPNETAVLY